MASNRGVTKTGSVLDRIVAEKLDDLERRKAVTPLRVLAEIVAGTTNGHAFTQVMSTSEPGASLHPLQIIAEIKKASPSKGVLAVEFEPIRIARAYTLAGAAGISVLTEANYFLGSLNDLLDVRKMLEEDFPSTRPSLLQKDFLFDPYQIVEARAYGADNVLLIVAMLEQPLLRELLAAARAEGLDALVEVHTEAEAGRAIEAGATLFGINNRDLHTFHVDLAVTERIRPLLPADAIVVGESGVHTRADAERLQRAGVGAILVGEAFMTAPDIAAKMAELRPEPAEGSRP